MIYSEIIKSKDNYDIPLLSDGKSVHSKYSPLREADSFGKDINEENHFTIVLGLGGGYHIESFLNRNKNQFVIVIEKSQEEINFLSSIECVKRLFTLQNVIIIPEEKILETITSTYLPAFYGGINILPVRAWYDYDIENSQKIISAIQNAIDFCSKDFSVQSHFGLIWQKNILNNLKTLDFLTSKAGKKNPRDDNSAGGKRDNCTARNKITLNTDLTACIIAAGPTLDKSIKELTDNREKYFIIATDTAFSVIQKNKIKCDAVISIDGQNLSRTHFIGEQTDNTIFIFDLQANSSAVNYAAKLSSRADSKNSVIFTKSGHPLSEYAEKNGCSADSRFLKLDCGAGTVTIAAIDFARQAGFKNIRVYGADFSYAFSKPYAKGTYFDVIYRENESKLSPGENLFTNLLFRTAAKKEKIELYQKPTVKITTEILDSYKKTFLDWIKNNGFSYQYKDAVYYITDEMAPEHISHADKNEKMLSCVFNYEKFLEAVKKDAGKAASGVDKIQSIRDLTDLETALLPAVAAIRTGKNLSFEDSIKLALSKIVEYNNRI